MLGLQPPFIRPEQECQNLDLTLRKFQNQTVPAPIQSIIQQYRQRQDLLCNKVSYPELMDAVNSRQEQISTINKAVARLRNLIKSKETKITSDIPGQLEQKISETEQEIQAARRRLESCPVDQDCSRNGLIPPPRVVVHGAPIQQECRLDYLRHSLPAETWASITDLIPDSGSGRGRGRDWSQIDIREHPEYHRYLPRDLIRPCLQTQEGGGAALIPRPLHEVLRSLHELEWLIEPKQQQSSDPRLNQLYRQVCRLREIAATTTFLDPDRPWKQVEELRRQAAMLGVIVAPELTAFSA
jgi:hypothetical protein